jgi:hypothetical protein
LLPEGYLPNWSGAGVNWEYFQRTHFGAIRDGTAIEQETPLLFRPGMALFHHGRDLKGAGAVPLLRMK